MKIILYGLLTIVAYCGFVLLIARCINTEDALDWEFGKRDD